MESTGHFRHPFLKTPPSPPPRSTQDMLLVTPNAKRLALAIEHQVGKEAQQSN